MKKQDDFTEGLDHPGDEMTRITAKVYGFKLPEPKEAIEPVDIFAIRPDPMQPRRIIPGQLRAWLPDMPGAGNVFFQYWMDAASREETGDDCNDSCAEWLTDMLRGDPEEAWTRPDKPGPVMAGLLKVIDLAASIKRDGLTNPITVVPTPAPPHNDREGNETRYLLETGERRWYAYHLLHQFDDGDWAKIPARVMAERSVWRQASENNQRDSLNAIGKARQFALLLMDLLDPTPDLSPLSQGRPTPSPSPLSQGHPTPSPSPLRKEGRFLPMGAFEREQDFYAQVADGEAFKIPKGKSSLLSSGLGVTNSQSLRTIRAVLRLPVEVWQIADDLNWTLGKVTPLTALPHDECLTLAANMAAEEGYSVEISTVSSKKTRKETAGQGARHLWLRRQLPKLRTDLGTMDAAEREKILDEMEGILREWRG